MEAIGFKSRHLNIKISFLSFWDNLYDGDHGDDGDDGDDDDDGDDGDDATSMSRCMLVKTW